MVLDERGRYDVHFLDNFNGDRIVEHFMSEKVATAWHCFDSKMTERFTSLHSLEQKLLCRTFGTWQHDKGRERKGHPMCRHLACVSCDHMSSVLQATRRPSSENAEHECIMKIYFFLRDM